MEDFDFVCGKKVAMGIALKMGVPVSAEFNKDSLNSSERKYVNRITMIIRAAELGEIRMENRNEVIEEEDVEDSDVDWDYESEGEEDDPMTGTSNKPTREKFDDALEYYRSSSKTNNKGEGVRSLASMQRRYRWITSQSILDRIVRYERTGEFPVQRNDQMKLLAEELYTAVQAVMDEGHEIHDLDIKHMALELNRQNKYWEKFTASDSWIDRWKRKYKIVSRNITVFVSVKTKKDMEKTLEKVKELREEVADIIRTNPGIKLWNSDQTGLVKEQHGKRTLANKGIKKVEAMCQSKSATSHSITLLPVLSSDGTQKKKLFVQLGERGGHFPPTINVFSHPDLYTAVHTSHMMTRETAVEFYKNVLFAPPVPAKLLLLLDSWPAFKDHTTIRSHCPQGTELFIKNIPPGATSICQPADLSYNHAVKAIQRRLVSMVMIRKINYQISQRDNLLKFSLQVYWILSADRFKPFIEYGFYKGGFIPNHPAPFPAPKAYIFGKGSDAPCICTAVGCTLCPKCEQAYCFNCFWVNMHQC